MPNWVEMTGRKMQLENTFMLQYRFNDWITFRETISFQYAGTKEKNYLPYNAIGAGLAGMADQQSRRRKQSEPEYPYRNTGCIFKSRLKTKDMKFPVHLPGLPISRDMNG